LNANSLSSTNALIGKWKTVEFINDEPTLPVLEVDVATISVTEQASPAATIPTTTATAIASNDTSALLLASSVEFSPRVIIAKRKSPAISRAYHTLAKSQKDKKVNSQIQFLNKQLPAEDIEGKLILATRVVQRFSKLMSVNEEFEVELRRAAEVDSLNEFADIKKRWHYTPDEMKQVLKNFEGVDDCELIKAKLARLHAAYPYYGGITLAKIQSWRSSQYRPKRQMGAPVDEKFESHVWSQLVICAIEKDDANKKENIKVLFNVVYTQGVIKKAAKIVQSQSIYADNAVVQRLDFSNMWVKNFLKRRNFSRRRITRVLKAIPDQASIREIMKTSQEAILAGDYDISAILNLDETAFNWGIGPTYIYTAKDADRGEQQITDEKARITAVLAIAGTGIFLPNMFIFKHSKSSQECPDQTRMNVIKNLHKHNGFTEADGWTQHIWSRIISSSGEDNDIVMHSVVYLRHTSGNIITSQYKAWNDTVRMAMYIDLILGPYAKTQRNEKIFLWQDNARLHKVKCLDEIYAENGVAVGYLPPNTTYMLQVLDLVVNGPLKACIRRNRVNLIYDYFQEFLALYEAEKLKPEAERVTPKWNPPKPTLIGAVKFILDLMRSGSGDGFCNPTFQEGIRKSFLSVGCTYHLDKSFTLYSNTANAGTMPIPPSGTVFKFENSEIIDVDLEENEEIELTDLIFEEPNPGL